MGLLGGWKIPEVGVEPAYTTREIPCSVYDIVAQCPKAARTLSFLE